MTPAEQLANWVSAKHQGHLKKYTDEPYFLHLLRVAQMAKTATVLGYEIGLCHDLLEDTGTTENELFETLLSFGYPDREANYITVRVVELTDVFTAAAYPNLSRKERKAKEESRLTGISSGAQTVKYADLIDNIQAVVEHEPKHVKRYLQKKQVLLAGMAAGDKTLHKQVTKLVNQSLTALKQLKD